MDGKDLIELGFKDTSWEDEGERFTEFTYKCPDFWIQVSGESLVEISLNWGSDWTTLKNCHTVKEMEDFFQYTERFIKTI